jgi:electron transport complex protein RnfC
MLARFHGGLRLPAHKAEASDGAPARCPLPPRLTVPLLQHAGVEAAPCVRPGDRVVRGQPLGLAAPGAGADVHSPCGGVVAAIERRPLHDRDLAAAHVVIDVDPGDGRIQRLPPLEPFAAPPEALVARIAACGIVGLGGAGFPAAGKLAAPCTLVVLNGAECEPWIASDDALLRACADEVVLGGRVLARAVGATRVQLAIEDTMAAAIAAARTAIAAHGAGVVELAVVPTRYPQGGERQLVRTLTGRDVPRAGRPVDLGILVHNVGTAQAAWRAVVGGEALVERLVTVTGPGVARPGVFVVAVGTPVADAVAAAGGYTDDATRLLLGGPMMGTALPDDTASIGKTHACVLVLGRDEVAATPALPCIRCGDCADVCPPKLLPQQLLLHARGGRDDRLAAQGLWDCIECGCCDVACPSHIPLVSIFRDAKAAIAARERAAAAADAARTRYEARTARLQREAAERARRDAEREASVATPDAVAAALARARARRAAPPGPTG